MRLLKIDNKLAALHLESAAIYNITDSIPGTIKQVICDNLLIMLTSTNLYYLSAQNGFTLCDITTYVTPTVAINDIKFVTGPYSRYNDNNYIGIITNSNDVFVCTTSAHNNKFISMSLVCRHGTNDIIAVSNTYLGYICKVDNKYVVFERSTKMCTLNELPTRFLAPNMFLCGSKIVRYIEMLGYFITAQEDIDYLYNERFFCDKDTRICRILSASKQEAVCEYYRTDYRLIVDFDTNHKIILDTRTNIVEYYPNTITNNRPMCNIARSYYHTEILGQYTKPVNVWSTDNHHLFGRYGDKLVSVILTCYKHCSLKQWIPRGVIHLIIGFVLSIK